MTRLLPWLAAALSCVACVKEKKTDKYKTSELIPHYQRMVSGGSIICGVWFALESDPNTPVLLENEALLTCNGTIMPVSGSGYVGTIIYRPGLEVAISLIREV